MAKRFLIVGLGRFGSSLAEEPAAAGNDVVAVDRGMEPVAAIKERVGYAAQLDATDPAALRAVEAQACAAAVVAIGEDFESAVLCVAALKEVGVGRIVARAQTAQRARILSAVGAAQVLEVEAEMGRRFAASLVEGR